MPFRAPYEYPPRAVGSVPRLINTSIESGMWQGSALTSQARETMHANQV